jgi:hypothetical protein
MFGSFPDLLTRVVYPNIGGVDPPESAPTFLLALQKPSPGMATNCSSGPSPLAELGLSAFVTECIASTENRMTHLREQRKEREGDLEVSKYPPDIY